MKRKLILISLCLFILIGLSSISAADVDIATDNGINENIGNLAANDEALKSVEENAVIQDEISLDEDDASFGKDNEVISQKGLKSADAGDVLSDDVYVSKTYVELNYYDITSDNPHSVNIFNDSDYVAVIHAPTQSDGTAHLSIGKNYDDAIEIFNSSVQDLDKEIDEDDEDYSFYYIRPYDILDIDVPDVYYVKVEYKRGFSSLTDYDEGYINFVEDSDHVRVEAPPEIVIGDFDKSYILIFVEGTRGNLRVLIDGKKVLEDSVFNLRYINETDEFRYYIPLFLDYLTVGTHTYSVSYYDGNWDNVTISNSIDVTYILEVYPNVDESYYDELPFYNDDTPFIYGDNVTFSIILPDDVKSSEIKVNGKSYDIFPIYGLASLTLSDLELGENILNFTYNDPYYGEKTFFLFLDVKPLNIPSTVLSGTDDGIKLRLPSDAQGKLNIYIWNEEEYDWQSVESIDVANGEADYIFDDYPWIIGEHLILVEFDGEKYNFSNESIIEIVPNVDYRNVSIGQGTTLVINVLGMKGNVTITLNGENLTTNELDYFGRTVAMIASEKLNVGKNIFTITYEGDSDYVPFANYDLASGKYVPIEYELWVEPLFDIPSAVSEEGAGVITLDLPEGTSGNITVYLNDEAILTTPVHSGENNISLSGLNIGDNVLKFVYTGDDGETYEFYRTVNVSKKTASIDIAIPAVTNVAQFTVTLPSDASGSLHAIVEGEIYRCDLKNGQATIVVPNLTSGVYDVKIRYTGDAKYAALEAEVPVMVYISPVLKDPKLSIKVPNVYQGKKVKVIIATNKSYTGNVKVKIKSKLYTVKVVKGKGTLYVSGLRVGTYTAAVTIAANKIFKYSKKTVKFKVKKNVYKLSLKKVTVKRSAKKLIIKAALRINGKLANGRKLKFKFANKVYTAKTNKKGLATITISKAILKKLKVGKSVRYQVSYGKKNVRWTVKVKR